MTFLGMKVKVCGFMMIICWSHEVRVAIKVILTRSFPIIITLILYCYYAGNGFQGWWTKQFQVVAEGVVFQNSIQGDKITTLTLLTRCWKINIIISFQAESKSKDFLGWNKNNWKILSQYSNETILVIFKHCMLTKSYFP